MPYEVRVSTESSKLASGTGRTKGPGCSSDYQSRSRQIQTPPRAHIWPLTWLGTSRGGMHGLSWGVRHELGSLPTRWRKLVAFALVHPQDAKISLCFEGHADKRIAHDTCRPQTCGRCVPEGLRFAFAACCWPVTAPSSATAEAGGHVQCRVAQEI
jgi:hypothetical protein